MGLQKVKLQDRKMLLVLLKTLRPYNLEIKLKHFPRRKRIWSGVDMGAGQSGPTV